ncbi:MAG: chorismate synthase [Bacteroidales bacterium]|nr:chorismate synthase [Bacteroidales bacterium]
MNNTIGRNVRMTLFGESHGSAIGAVLDGFAAGVEVDEAFIARQLSRRRPQGSKETARVERDDYRIVSGVFNGHTTGEPICIIIENGDCRSADYEQTRLLARPSHADFVSHLVHNGYEDYRGGGHFSGRITAPIVAVGAICLTALRKAGIEVGTHILRCGNACDTPFETVDDEVLSAQIREVEGKDFPVIMDGAEKEMSLEIEQVRREGDSIGGIIQTAVTNLPAGLGAPWFGSVEGELANAMLSIGGVKGIEFGLGFGFADVTGKSGNDCFAAGRNDRIRTTTNHNGGINGGLSNGMPVVFNCAVKPTPSIAAPQQTVNMETGEEEMLAIKGRHDPAIIRRISIVVTSMTAIVLCDLIRGRLSNNFFN